MSCQCLLVAVIYAYRHVGFMPLPSPSDKDCVSKAIEILMKEGRPRDQAIAIAESHCKAKKALFGMGDCSNLTPNR